MCLILCCPSGNTRKDMLPNIVSFFNPLLNATYREPAATILIVSFRLRSSWLFGGGHSQQKQGNRLQEAGFGLDWQ